MLFVKRTVWQRGVDWLSRGDSRSIGGGGVNEGKDTASSMISMVA